MRRTLLTLGLGAPVLLASALTTLVGVPAAHADGCPTNAACVVVDVVGSVTTSRTFSQTEVRALQQPVSSRYVTQSKPSGTPDSTRGTGDSPQQITPLRSLVAAVPNPSGAGTVDPDQVTFTEVLDSFGVSHPLGQGDLGPAGGNGFENGWVPGVFDLGGDASESYLRPLRNDDDVNISADPNYGGVFQSDSGSPLHVTVHTTGQLLATSVTAASTTVQVGQPDRLAADVAPPPGATWSWSFGRGDTGTASTQETTHTWTAAGTYGVVVTVHGTDGSFGRSSPLSIQVGAAPPPTPTPTPSPGAGTGGPKNPATGPKNGSGSNNGGKPGTKPGTADTGTKGSDGTNGSVTGSGPLIAGLTGSSNGQPATSGPAAPYAPVYQPPLIGLLSGGVQQPPAATSGQSGTSPTIVPVGSTVSGTLLLSADDAAASSSSAQSAAQSKSQGTTGSTSAARRLTEQSRGPLPAWLLLPLALAVLLGAGALGESARGERLRARARAQLVALGHQLGHQLGHRLARRTSLRRHP